MLLPLVPYSRGIARMGPWGRGPFTGGRHIDCRSDETYVEMDGLRAAMVAMLGQWIPVRNSKQHDD
jgi:hypothetical protein